VSRLLAGIDLGTNTVRLLVAEADAATGLAPRWADQAVTRLGEGLTARGTLAPAAAERTLTAVRRYRDRARVLGAAEVLLVATAAVRQARDGREFLALLQAEPGIRPRIVSGEEEADLTLLGASWGLGALGGTFALLDIGGGMGVDYDGSKTMFEASMNYTMQEFANNAVYVIRTVCDDENVPHPHLVTESGRVMTAYHAVLVMSIRDEIETFAGDQPQVTVDADDPQVITELKELFDGINAKNYREYYHDALEHKDELHTQFDLGLVSLEDRAKGEVLFWETCARAYKLSRSAKAPEEEFEGLRRILASKYLCNFSVFRSAPDSWAIGQLFPVMPIHRLNEVPTDFATLVDVTCDSDGKIDRFVDLRDVKEVLELHPFRGEPYYLATFLVGAYQEVMGSYHNLFGQTNEAHVVIDNDGRFHVTKIIPGSSVADMLAFARYDPAQLQERFARRLTAKVEAGALSRDDATRLAADFALAASQQTYLE
jgi:arginine decarboxylase